MVYVALSQMGIVDFKSHHSHLTTGEISSVVFFCPEECDWSCFLQQSEFFAI